MKEKTPPKNLEYVKAIADYFNVSIDYLLGEAPTPTNNIDIKDFCNKYGLNENSLLALEFHNRRKNDFKKVFEKNNINADYKEIDTINYLLEDLLINKQNSIIEAITDYLYFDSNSKTKINIQTTINGINENIKTSTDLLLDLVFFEDIKSKLNFLKTEIKKEGEI